jgi:hypothetical protein
MVESVNKNIKNVQIWNWNIPHCGMLHLHNKAIV